MFLNRNLQKIKGKNSLLKYCTEKNVELYVDFYLCDLKCDQSTKRISLMGVIQNLNLSNRQ